MDFKATASACCAEERTHARTHARTRTHTRTHTHARTHTHTHIHTYTHTHTHERTHARTHARTHTHIHTDLANPSPEERKQAGALERVLPRNLFRSIQHTEHAHRLRHYLCEPHGPFRLTPGCLLLHLACTSLHMRAHTRTPADRVDDTLDKSPSRCVRVGVALVWQ